MFGSEILEVAIGVGVLYLVLSLVCSAITEAVARAFAMRSGTLRSGIRNLLCDPHGEGLARDFYDHPLVKGLYRQKMNWNNDALYDPLPVTLGYAKVLARVVKRMRGLGSAPYQFRFFM
ncbi:MAG: Piwi domain protein [uncultured Rubrobacteraceae bacterium]|uniref:Piwi domain protein n=1 Tax=uncultured Rubrobacteraceae bacterium TaxID=349277 RepID=A0A6J4QTM7_9ACTN|nr:MAG: Piwi domain protein [uncultured Rubrobacteraceae bacterium]